MARSKKLKTFTLSEVKDKYIGKEGSENRDRYEFELKLELLGEMIKTARKERNLTQEELGQLVGVQKAQISKLEKGSKNVTIATVLKIFDALQAKIKLQVDLTGTTLT
ncbi:MAG: helix-turn-helix domain-containing protein [Aureispira sp.]